MKTSTSKSFFKTTTFTISLLFIVAMQSSLQAQCADPSPTGDCDGDLILNQDDLDDDNDGILDTAECIPSVIVNNDFETFNPADALAPSPFSSTAPGTGNSYQFPQASINGWSTTAPDGRIEIWESNHRGGTSDPNPTPSFSGGAHAEIAATDGTSQLYQDVATTPGAIISWSIWHRGRRGLDEANVLIGNPTGTLSIQQLMASDNTAWINYTGTYIVPSGQTMTRFAFQSISTAASALGAGNFIDNFVVQVCPDTDGDGTTNDLDNDSDNDGCPDALEGDGSFTTDDLDGDNSLGDTADTNPSSATYGAPIVNSSVAVQNTTTAVITATQVVINASPTNQTTFVGLNATFTAAAAATNTTIFTGTAPNTTPDYTSGTNANAGLSYQWQEDSGSGFTNISNGGVYSGATTVELTLTAVTAAMNGNSYKLVVTHIDNDCILLEETVQLTADNVIIAGDDDFSGTPLDGTKGGNTVTVFTDDTINGVAFTDAVVIPTITDNDGITGLAINADGTLTIPADTDAGTYSITYQICEVGNTDNCNTAVVDLVIDDEIIANDDDFTAIPINGTNGGSTITVFTDDTIDGVAFANAAVIPSITDNDGIAGLAISTNGSLIIPANTNAGTYQITYQICEVGNTDNCDTAVVDIVIENEIIANDDDFSTTPVDGTNGGNTATVFTDDRIDDNPFTGAAVIPTIIDNDGIAGLLINADGTLTIPANTDAGTYGITYQICEVGNTDNCDTAVVDIVIENEIFANDDDFSATPVDGTNGGNTATVFSDDTIDATAFANAAVIPTITDNDGITGLAINADGTLTIPADTDAGIYSITYQICEVGNTDNCDTAAVAIEVENEIVANDDDFSATPVDGTNGGSTATVFTDDTIDNASFTDTAVIPSITDNDGIVGLAINADGTLTIPADTDAGTYSITYQICEVGNTDNCDTAVVAIEVENEIVANDDDFLTTPINGNLGGNTASVFTDDTIDNTSFADAYVIPSITADGGINGLAINADGTLTIPANTPPGDYNITYQICEAGNTDNCDTATVAIAVLPDTDGDGVLDTIDLDDDNDGILDIAESGGLAPSNDEDGDGIPNWNDTTDDGNAGDGSSTSYADANGDGVPDAYDFDGDGIPNHLDLDADNDGIYDVIESDGTDANNDGRADDNDNNVDNTASNGIPTSAGTGIMNPRDTGNNNSADYLNTDSDGDGCADAIEAGFADENADGALGDAPLTVDAHGLVTSSAGYAAPTETNSGIPDYTDKAINSCASISITKSSTLVDTNGNGRDDAGDTINYTFMVSNTGSVDLTDIGVTDALATVTPTTTINLAAGAVDNSTFTASYVVKQADLNSGSFTNTAIASGKDPGGTTISDNSDDPTNNTNVDDNGDGDPDDPTVTNFTQDPSNSLLKTGVLEDDNNDGFPNAGEKIRYSFSVENTGNVTLTNITIDDPLVTVIGGPISLEPGVIDNSTFYALYTLTQANVDNGSITNAAVVTSKDPNNVDITDNSDDPTNNANVDDNGDGDPDDDTVITLLKNASIELFKTGAFVDTNSDGAGQIGETVGYIFDVRNTGNVTLTGITINDPKVTVMGGPITLLPGELDNTTFSASYPLTLADINAAEVINTATATSKDPDNIDVMDTSDDPTTVDPEDATIVKIASDPKIFLFKYATFNDENGDTFANAGETITYTFDVRNTGNVTLTNIMITDPLITVNGGPINLNPAQFDDTTFSGTYTLTQANVEAGTIENQAEVVATDNLGGTVNGISDFSDDPNNPDNIDLNGDGNPDDPTVTELPVDPSISLEKVGVFNDENGDGLAQVGETMSYTFRIENTGNIAINNVIITDPIAAVNGGPITVMAPGDIDTTTFTANYAITQADIDAGEVSNLATVIGQDGDGDDITDDSDDPNELADSDNNNDGEPDDPTIIATPQESSISLTKEATPTAFANAGDVISYTLIVTNTGNTTLSNVVVTDNNATITSGSPVATLAPGSTATVMASYTITQNDMNAESFTNVATVTSRDPQDNLVTDTSDDPNDATDVDDNGDGEPDDPTVVELDSDGDGLKNSEDLDDDNDGITDVEEQNGFDFLDTDGDGIVDRLDLDADGDGINDVEEAGHGIADTDGDGRLDDPVGTDGIPDSVQNDANVGMVTYTPRDTDGDGKHDFQDVDDDGDGVLTSQELTDGTNPLEGCDLVYTNISAVPETSWSNADCDGDGVTNGTEIADGTDPTNTCDFIAASITEPLGPNFTMSDCDGDGVTNEQEALDGTDPEDPCDFELASVTLTPNVEWNEADCDGDGVTNGQEMSDGTDPKVLCDYVLDNATIAPSDAWNAADCDGDLVSNAQELADGTEPDNHCDHINGTPLGGSDCDADGLTNQEEEVLGTDPENPDTDGDGITDGQEVLDNTSALDPCVSNGGTPPAGSACAIEIENELMTPDGDGINDYFRMKNIEQFPENTVEIYNRWGVKVYTTTGYDNQGNVFTGISNGRVTIKANETLPAGVYYFIINYNDGGETKSESGYLYINQ